MTRIEFTEEEIEKLRYERFHHPHPRVQQKMEALLLKSQGVPHWQICEILAITENTLRAYLQAYLEGGVEKLKELNFPCPQSELAAHAETWEGYFREHPPATIKEAVAKIEELTGIRRSETQVRQFLKSLGMRRLKLGAIPAKADPEKQAIFKKEVLDPRLAEAQAGRRAVFFVDAAHFVLAPFLGYLWCFARCFIKAPAGRQGFNVLGALNAVTHELITVTNDAYLNAITVCELLRKIAEANVGVPISLILDNARYQKCAVVREVAESLNIELVYLPSYSPNLNLIERFWKFIKKQVLYSKYYADFAAFSEAISNCIGLAHPQHKQQLDSLLRLRFQTFDRPQLGPAEFPALASG